VQGVIENAPFVPMRADNKRAKLLDDDGAAAASAGSSSSIAAVQDQVARVHSTMQDNVNVMVQNIEKSSALEERSSELASQAARFQTTARQTRRHLWWQMCKQRLICAAVGGTALIVLILIICSLKK
jgi:hypothetical protein